MRLNRKILLITISILFVSLLATSVVTLLNFRKNYTDALLVGSLSVGQSLASVATELLNLGLPLDSLAGMEKKILQVKENNPHLAYVGISDMGGKVLFHSDVTLLGKVFSDEVMRTALDSKKPLNQDYSRFDGGRYYDVTIPIIDSSAHQAGIVRLGFPKRVVDDRVLEALIQLALSFTVAFVVIAYFINALLSRHVSRPVIALADVAKAIAAGRFDNLQQLDRADEIGVLSRALHQMAQTISSQLEALQKSRDEMEQLVAVRTRELADSNTQLGSRNRALMESDSRKEELFRQLQQMSEAVKQSTQAIVLIDGAACFTYVNPAFTAMFGYALDEIAGHHVAVLQSTRRLDADDEMAPSALVALGIPFSGKVMRRTKEGRDIPIMLNLAPVFDDDGVITGHVGVLSDLTEIEQRQAELEHMAQHDALTGLPNRLLLRDRMNQALAQARRRQQLVAICYIDLDGFKPINDSYGHKAGDQVLVEVAQRLGRAVRSGDTVARLGGDEFALILSDFTEVAEIEQALERIQHDIAETFVVEERQLTLSASIGVDVCGQDEHDTDTLLRNADKAMYSAKQAGKNRYFFFNHHEEERSVTEHEQRRIIAAALEQGQFVLHYQPKVDMRSGKVIGTEALVRWQHPVEGLKAPGSFLPTIENHLLIVDLGHWVLAEAMRQMRLWQQQDIHLDISINVAALQLQQPDFVARLQQLLTDYPDILPSRIELEILESAALDDIDMVGRIIDECQALGFQFALDDFGTGYSSLTYLKRLTARTLKVDQSFIRDMLEDPEDLAITEGVLGLARAFQRTAIAEGVETVAHGSMLLRLGCDLAQGYGIARPMPPEALPAWLDAFTQPAEWIAAAAEDWDREDFPLLLMEAEHGRWASRILQAARTGNLSLLPADVQDYRSCNFCQWLRGDAFIQFRALPQYRHIEEPHRKSHEVAFDLAMRLQAGDSTAIEAGIATLTEQRDTVVAGLHELQQVVLEQRRR